MNLNPIVLIKRIKDGFLDGWYFKGDDQSSDRMALLMCNYTSNIIANFVGGSFWTGFLLILMADDGFIGTLSMISSAANMLQFFAPVLLERFPKRKKMLIAMRGGLYLINVLFIGFIPLFPDSMQQVRLYMVALGVLAANLLSAFSSPGISVWHVQSLPNKVRKNYFSAVTMTVGAVVAVCNLLGGWLVDAFTAHDMQYEGLLALRIIASVIAVAELILYAKIREYPYESTGEKFRMRDLILAPLKEKKYLLTVGVTFLWNVTANMPGSYYTVYLLKNIGMSYSTITLINMLNVPIVLLLTPIWRKVLGKYGWFKTLYVSMFVYAAHYFMLALVTGTTVWMYTVALIWANVFAIGINLSFTGIPYVNMPAQNQTAFLGLYQLFAYMAVLIGVSNGKTFIVSVGDASVMLMGIEFTGKQLLVALTGALEIIAAGGIYLINIKAGRPQA